MSQNFNVPLFFLDSQSSNSKENFQIVNKNFARVRKNEGIVTSALKQYEDKIEELTAAELKSETASIVHTLIQEAESRKNTFLQKIGSLSSNLATPVEIELLEILSREPEFCNSFYCYKNSIFKIEQNKITVITQKYKLHLEPKILISCALIKNNKLSAYHHGLAQVEGDFWSFEDKNLPKLHISPEKQHLSHNPRKFLPDDLIAKNILVLYHKEMIAFQCLQVQLLSVDESDYRCNNTTLKWYDNPKVIKDKISGEILSSHTQIRNKRLTWDLKENYHPPDIQTLLITKFEQSHLDKIRSFFSDTSPQKITIFSGLGIFVIFLLCSPIFCFLWKKPQINNRASKFCCGVANPFLKWKMRVEHIKMRQQLEEIKNGQSEPLNQPENQDEANPNFDSFSVNPTQPVHPEIVKMIVDLNQQLAHQTATITNLEQQQRNSKLIINNLTSRATTTPRPSAPEIDSLNNIMDHQLQHSSN